MSGDTPILDELAGQQIRAAAERLKGAVERMGEKTNAALEAEAGAREAELADRIEEIGSWWGEHARHTIKVTAPKAAEYGSADLDIMGQAMVAMAGSKLDGMTEHEKLQFGRYAACAFYALGKTARMFGALERGVLPNADAEHDNEVYSVMMARIRETGSWV